jgi:serine/threonine protein kinase
MSPKISTSTDDFQGEPLSSDDLAADFFAESPIVLPAAPLTDAKKVGNEYVPTKAADDQSFSIQVCKAIFPPDGRIARIALKPAIYDFGVELLHLRKDNGNHEAVSVIGGRADFASMAPTEFDATPSFANISILFCPAPERNSDATRIISFPSEAARAQFANELCAAGCIMPDLKEHVRLSDTPAGLPVNFRLAVPVTTRTRTAEQFVIIKVANSTQKEKELMNEIKILRTLDHSAILRAHGIYRVSSNGTESLGLVIDYKAGSDLATWIPPQGLELPRAREVYSRLCNAVEYLHSLRIVHRDIKPSNILCKRAGDRSLKAILSDFGLSTRVDDIEAMSIRCGTGGYIAPEIFSNGWADWCSEFGPDAHAEYEDRIGDLLKVDVFSLGMLLYTMTTGSNDLITDDLTETYRRNAQGRLPEWTLQRLPHELQALIGRLCQIDPRARCSMFGVESKW